LRFGRRRSSALSPDPELIRTLAELLAENNLTEIEYRVGNHLVRVSRRGLTTAAVTGSISGTVPVTAPLDTAAGTPAQHPGAVTAPMVGTVYLAPQPGAPAFVRIGDTVEPGQAVLIIEAMKVMNEIRVSRAGRVAEILVEDAQPVEYGMVLMLIE
jgi:acetyl-CoA carboxylase biotin carboxyl carrier protein